MGTMTENALALVLATISHGVATTGLGRHEVKALWIDAARLTTGETFDPRGKDHLHKGDWEG